MYLSMLKKYKDVIAGGFVILLGAALYIASLSIKSLPMNLLKADFFPKMAACMFGFLGICLVMEGIKSAKAFDENAKGDGKDDEDNASGTIVGIYQLFTKVFYLMLPIGILG